MTFTAAVWRSSSVRQPWRSDAAIARSRLAVVLEEVGNADNVGGVFRNAAAFGADLVVLSPGVLRSAVSQGDSNLDGRDAARPIRPSGRWVAGCADHDPRGRVRAGGADAARAAEPLDAFARGRVRRSWRCIVGAEGPGLTPAVESAADHRLRIPIAAGVDSLNLAVATGIALEQVTRNTRGRGILAAPKGTQT